MIKLNKNVMECRNILEMFNIPKVKSDDRTCHHGNLEVSHDQDDFCQENFAPDLINHQNNYSHDDKNNFSRDELSQGDLNDQNNFSHAENQDENDGNIPDGVRFDDSSVDSSCDQDNQDENKCSDGLKHDDNVHPPADFSLNDILQDIQPVTHHSAYQGINLQACYELQDGLHWADNRKDFQLTVTKSLNHQALHDHQDGLCWTDSRYHLKDFQHTVTRSLDHQALHEHQEGLYWADTYHHKEEFQHTVVKSVDHQALHEREDWADTHHHNKDFQHTTTKSVDHQALHEHQDGLYWADTHHYKGDLQHTVLTQLASQDSRRLGSVNKPLTSTRTSSRVKTVYGASTFLIGLLVFQLMTLTSATGTEVVSVQPPVLVIGLEHLATFTCASTSAVIVDVEWFINGISFSTLQLAGANQNSVQTLTFNRVPLDYNNTRISCRANITTGVVTSGTSTLLVQGSLSAAGSLTVLRQDSDLNLRWAPPFTLDTDDISYCVDVVNSTSSATLHSECGITVTEFTYPLPPRSWCDVYNFTITPVNVVGNGTRTSIQYSGAISKPRLQQVIPLLSFTMSAPVCSSQVTLVDIDTGEVITLGDTDLTISETNITFTTQQLRQNRHYNVTITASNAAGSATSEEIISTHDITSFSASLEENGIVISPIFTQNSNATGALCSFIFIDESGSVDPSKSSILLFNRIDVSHGVLLELNLFYQGHYMMFVYDIEENGQLMNGTGYPASGDNDVIINGKLYSDGRISDVKCNITSLAGLITVTCLFARFQISAQILDPDRVGVLHINTTTETQTPVTVQVMENGEYLVTVFPIQDGVGILSGVEFSQIILMVDDIPTTQGSSSDSPTLGVTTSEKEISMQTPAASHNNIAVVAVVVVLVVVVVAVGFLKSRQRKKAAKLIPNMHMTLEKGRVQSSSITMQSSRSGPPTTTVRTEEPTYTTVHDTQQQILTHVPNTPAPTPTVPRFNNVTTLPSHLNFEGR